MDGHTIEPTDVIKDLGILISNDLCFTIYINSMVTRHRRIVGWFLSVFHTRDAFTIMTLYKSLVRSILEYNCMYHVKSLGSY